jgi:amidophosphoribosyltransferase
VSCAFFRAPLHQEKHNAGKMVQVCKHKLDVEAGNVTLVVRSNHAQPIQDVFAQINDRMKKWLLIQNMRMMWLCKKKNPIFRRIVLGHVRYGMVKTVSKAYILLRQNNWMHRNLILAGNFNMTNVKELFKV